jgi:hypothetical protein
MDKNDEVEVRILAGTASYGQTGAAYALAYAMLRFVDVLERGLATQSPPAAG